MRRILLLVTTAIAVSGCQTAQPPQDVIWLRTDGQSQVGRPDLQQKFEVDKTVCVGETQKSAVGAPVVYSNGSLVSELSAAAVQQQQGNALVDVMKGCMAQKGYLLVPKSQALAMSKQLKANQKKAN